MRIISIYFISLFSIIALNSAHAQTGKTSKVNNSPGKLITQEAEVEIKFENPEGWSEEEWKAYDKQVNREELFSTIKAALLDGRLKARSYFIDTLWFSPKQVSAMLTRIDTFYVENIATHAMEATVIDNSYKGKDLAVIRMKEQWYLDPKSLVMHKKVTGISFHVNTTNDNGTIKGLRPLFYVPLAQEENSH
jgi:hypothetical protein